MAAPDERAFTVFDRGHARDRIILESMRNSLRTLTNPTTGTFFTEDEIQRATQPGSRFYIEAEAIDLYGMSQQNRARFFADQIDPRRANSSYLLGQHGPMWLGEDSLLDAVGASGLVQARGAAGSTYVGSTTLGDPAATTATDGNGTVYQVLVTQTIAAGEDTVLVTMQAVLTGATADGQSTNLVVGSVLTWSANPPVATEPQAAVFDQGNNVGFTGGFDQETQQDYATRIGDRIQARPASGNAAHFQAWARQASVATEQGFAYPTGLQAGSVVIAITQKRNTTGTPQGPLARVPSVGLLTTLTTFLVAPGSPVVPGRVYVVVTTVNFELANQIERISMSQGIAGGWFNVVPWPNPPDAGAATEQIHIITPIVDQENFTLTTASLLPGQTPGVPLQLVGDAAPSIMAWDRDTSRFERLLVNTIDHDGVTTAVINLTQGPSFTLVDDTDPDGGTRVSPYTDRLVVIAEAIEQYFDSLGPGELVATTDPRFARAARNPRPEVNYPARAGQGIIAILIDSLGNVAKDAELTFIAQNDPTLPVNLLTGPNIVGVGHVNVYPLS